MDQDLGKIIQLMSRTYDWDISMYDETFLKNTLDNRLSSVRCGTLAAYREVLAESGAEAQAFFRSLLINYSEFFRDTLAFAVLERVVLPGLIVEKEQTARPEIRVWSAGCAAGQEPYSVSILLDELTAARGSTVSFRIFGTDISETELAQARRGVYDGGALRNMRLGYIDRYFDGKDGFYGVVPKLKERVSFSIYDLLDESSTCPPASIYGGFDLVVCSNALFYYRPEIRQAILNKLHGCLSDGGVLMTGEAEGAIVARHEGFRAVVPAATVYRKASRRRFDIRGVVR